MKKFKVAFAALAAVAGIGGAYASAHSNAGSAVGTIYNWHSAGGAIVTVGTLGVGKDRCPIPGAATCLRGTAPGKPVQRLTKPA